MDGEQVREDQDTVRRDRKERGVERDAHLQAAREHAQRANAEARGRRGVEPQPEENEAAGSDEAQGYAAMDSRDSRDSNEAAMKARARARYEGSDDSFEQEWPAIRERLLDEDMQKGVERIRRRL